MSYSILERPTIESGAEPVGHEVRRRNPLWLILLFVLVGLSISVGVSMLAGSSPYGVLIVAAIMSGGHPAA